LPKELRLAGIVTVEAANAFIRGRYLPAHNARFAVEPAVEGSAFTPLLGVDLDEILCVEEERQVGQDNCVSYRTLNPGLRSGGRCGRTSSGRGSRSTSIRTARTPSSTDPAASADMTRTERSEMRKTPLKSPRRRNPVDGMDEPPACPPRPQENKSTRSGQITCYQNRTTQTAIDRQCWIRRLAVTGRLAGDPLTITTA
jgi:hypothetical protein